MHIIPLSIINARLRQILTDYVQPENQQFFSDLLGQNDPIKRQTFILKYLVDQEYFNEANKEYRDIFADLFISTLSLKKQIDPELKSFLPDAAGNFTQDVQKNLLFFTYKIALDFEKLAIFKHLQTNQAKYSQKEITEILQKTNQGQVIFAIDANTGEEKLLISGKNHLNTVSGKTPAQNTSYLPAYSYSIPEETSTVDSVQSAEKPALDQKNETKEVSASVQPAEIKKEEINRAPEKKSGQKPISGPEVEIILDAKEAIATLNKLENLRDENAAKIFILEDYLMNLDGSLQGRATILEPDPQNPEKKKPVPVTFYSGRNPAASDRYFYFSRSNKKQKTIPGGMEDKDKKSFFVPESDLSLLPALLFASSDFSSPEEEAEAEDAFTDTNATKPAPSAARAGGLGLGRPVRKTPQEKPRLPGNAKINPDELKNYYDLQKKVTERRVTEEQLKNQEAAKKQPGNQKQKPAKKSNKKESNALLSVIKYSGIAVAATSVTAIGYLTLSV